MTGCSCHGSSSHTSLVMTDDLEFCSKCSTDVQAKLVWVLILLEALKGPSLTQKGIGEKLGLNIKFQIAKVEIPAPSPGDFGELVLAGTEIGRGGRGGRKGP